MTRYDLPRLKENDGAFVRSSGDTWTYATLKEQVSGDAAHLISVVDHLTGIKLVADISATSPHHFLVFYLSHLPTPLSCVLSYFASFWRKIKIDCVSDS